MDILLGFLGIGLAIFFTLAGIALLIWVSDGGWRR